MAEKKKGRPSQFIPEFCDQAKKLCYLGATDKELGDFFGVSEQTINTWKTAHPEFLESLKEGKGAADAKVAESLFKRALGYSHPAVKIAANAATGESVQVPYTEHYAPDTTACIFWLKNRRSDLWRDKQEMQHSGGIETQKSMEQYTDEELQAILEGRSGRTAQAKKSKK